MPRPFALALCAFGALLVVVGLRQSSRARAARGWTRTTARVIESRVERRSAPDEERDERFRLVIRYGYEAGGRRHESEQVWIDSEVASASVDAAWPQRWVERFPAGAEVPAWFDPADPRQAVLVREIPGRQVAGMVAIGAVLLGVGVFLLARSSGR